ncbi:hypothetical protein KBC75_00535 [Candidatus Shapirobacteria bacterium]|nr:hypothetical protein [Candidatus Shapirobacteria bacterium]
MATITVNQYNDDGTTARTAGETLAINGAIYTQRTDTRWFNGAPASMTGCYAGNTVISATLGGGFVIDGTKVRWLAITGGSGTPAIGDIVSQGGVSGYYLGFWASLTDAPSATIGTTGFIKFREVAGGNFGSGALTFSGAGAATATGADVTGWLEVVVQQSGNFNVPRLGNFTTRGDWFYLDDTTGSANQLLTVPTNGSTTTYSPGVWIETAVGSDNYEFYSAIYAVGMSTTNFGTDERSKVVCMETNGQMRIGNNGTTDVGYVPPSGCKTRIPNIFLRQCTSAARATNAIPHATVATRPDFTTTSAGYIDIEYTYGDWYLLFAQAFYVKIKHCATMDGINVSECASPLEIDDGGAGSSAGLALAGGYFTSCFGGGTIQNWVFSGYSNGLTGGMCSFAYCIGQRVVNCKSGCWTYARSATKSFGFYTSQSTDIQFNNCQTLNCTNELLTSFNCEVNNFDYCDRYAGATNTTTGLYSWIVTASCDTIKIDGITFGIGGIISNVHPYNGIISCLASSNVRFRNFGSRSSFLNGGSANFPAYIFADGGNNINVKVQRCYLQPTRTAAHSSQNSSKNMLFEDCYGDWLDTVTMAGLNAIERGGSGKMTTTGQTSVYGTHFGGAFMSDTWGAMWLALNEPSAETLQYTDKNFTTGSGFTSAGGLSLATVDDYFSCSMQEARLQITGFVGATPWVIGTNPQNHDYDYQIHTGTTWSDWKQLTTCRLRAGGGTAGTNTFTIATVTGSREPQIGDFVTAQLGTQFAEGCTVTNIVGTTITLSDNILVTLATNLPVFFSNNLNYETVSPNVGYMLKFKVTCKIAANTNLVSYIQCNTNSTYAAQIDNLFPLDTATITLQNIVTGSVYEVYNLTTLTTLSTGTKATAQNVDQIISASANDGDVLRIRVRKSSASNKYEPFETNATISNQATTVYVSQTLDALIG